MIQQFAPSDVMIHCILIRQLGGIYIIFRSVYLAGHRLTTSGIFSRLLAVGCTGKACFGLAVGCTGKARFGLAVDCIGKARFRGPIRISSRLHWAIRLGLGLGSD